MPKKIVLQNAPVDLLNRQISKDRSQVQGWWSLAECEIFPPLLFPESSYSESEQSQRSSVYISAVGDEKKDPVSGFSVSNRSTKSSTEFIAPKEMETPWQGFDRKDVSVDQRARGIKNLYSTVSRISDQTSSLSKLVKNSGIYALSSLVSPLISLALSPFLTHHLSTSDYGMLTLLNTIITLVAGITQLGLGSAFFRAYNYDYTENRDKRDVVSTAAMLLFVVSLLSVIGVIVEASSLATLLLGRSSLNRLIIIAAGILFVQNLTIPGFAWLRAEGRALLYSLLSISNLLITLIANIVLVGVLHWGITGSLIATGGGYFGIVICTLPLIILRAGIRVRIDIARNLLGFGIPLLLNLVSYWILQLSDRYLLSHFSSFTETAKYAVVYNLGSALSTVVITPFTLAWPATMFTIAKRKNASRIFKLLFHWFSLVLLLSSFGLSLFATLLLNWLFPLAYHSASLIIPVISLSGVFYGTYYVFTTGVNIKRKTWVIGIFTAIAAITNFLANLILIPRYGAMGAALSTLIAFIVLALVAFIVNQKMYPVAFEIGRFIVALLLGIVLYLGGNSIAQGQRTYETLGIYAAVSVLYIFCLIFIGMLPPRRHTHRKTKDISIEDTDVIPVPLLFWKKKKVTKLL